MFFAKYLICKVKPANFLQSWKKLLLFFHIEFLMILTRIKSHCCNKIEYIASQEIIPHLCQGFWTSLGILKCVSKMF